MEKGQSSGWGKCDWVRRNSIDNLRNSDSSDVQCTGEDKEDTGNVCEEPYARMFRVAQKLEN